MTDLAKEALAPSGPRMSATGKEYPKSGELAIVPAERNAVQEVKALYNIMAELKKKVLKPDVDYGVIPGTGTKPTLLLPGMEKIMRALYAVPEYIERRVICDYDKLLFHYEYECRLIDVDSGSAIPGGRGLGLCTSMESAFRYRQANRKCPSCDQEAIIKGKTEYGGGWLCFKKKGGCGAKFKDGDQTIEAQATGRVENPDICDQINAIMKRAKKRALGDAVKGAAAVSEFFTVDLEDFTPYSIQQPKVDIVEAEFVEVTPDPTPPPPPAEKTSEPDAETISTFDTGFVEKLTKSVAFMYDTSKGEFHLRGSIQKAIAPETGYITPGIEGYKAIELIMLHRSASDFEMDETAVFEQLSLSLNNDPEIKDFAGWYKVGRSMPQAWEVVKAYHENKDLAPAQPVNDVKMQ